MFLPLAIGVLGWDGKGELFTWFPIFLKQYEWPKDHVQSNVSCNLFSVLLFHKMKC